MISVYLVQLKVQLKVLLDKVLLDQDYTESHSMLNAAEV